MHSSFVPGLLEGRTAFVTGGTSGINLGIAMRLAEAGARVSVLGRDLEKARAAKAAIDARAGANRALALSADVRDPAALGAALGEAVKTFGLIDILVAGAAGNFPAPALNISPNGFKAVVDIDLLGTFHACRLGFEHLRKPGASIIAISAPQAGLPTMMQAHVCAAKAGVDMLARTLALEWGSAGVRVNAIWPGAVEGTEGMSRLAPDERARGRLASRIPLGRFATVEDIAETALFLASPSAGYVTGGVFLCDGGLSLLGMNALLGV